MNARHREVTAVTEKFEHGPLNTYEVIYTSGYVEAVEAHQVLMPPMELPLFGGVTTETDRRWTFHGEFDGRWELVLSVPADDVKSVRNVTRTNERAS
jgi:hypothetical protein